jgi:hypothetical protein
MNVARRDSLHLDDIIKHVETNRSNAPPLDPEKHALLASLSSLFEEDLPFEDIVDVLDGQEFLNTSDFREACIKLQESWGTDSHTSVEFNNSLNDLVKELTEIKRPPNPVECRKLKVKVDHVAKMRRQILQSAQYKPDFSGFPQSPHSVLGKNATSAEYLMGIHHETKKLKEELLPSIQSWKQEQLLPANRVEWLRSQEYAAQKLAIHHQQDRRSRSRSRSRSRRDMARSNRSLLSKDSSQPQRDDPGQQHHTKKARSSSCQRTKKDNSSSSRRSQQRSISSGRATPAADRSTRSILSKDSTQNGNGHRARSPSRSRRSARTSRSTTESGLGQFLSPKRNHVIDDACSRRSDVERNKPLMSPKMSPSASRLLQRAPASCGSLLHRKEAVKIPQSMTPAPPNSLENKISKSDHPRTRLNKAPMSCGSALHRKRPATVARPPPSLFAPNLDLLETMNDKKQHSPTRTRGSAATTTGRRSTHARERPMRCSVVGDSKTQLDSSPSRFSSPPASPRRQQQKSKLMSPLQVSNGGAGRGEAPCLSPSAEARRCRKQGIGKPKYAGAAVTTTNNDDEIMNIQQQQSRSQVQLLVKVAVGPQSPPTPPRGGERRGSHNRAHIDIVVHCPWARG